MLEGCRDGIYKLLLNPMATIGKARGDRKEQCGKLGKNGLRGPGQGVHVYSGPLEGACMGKFL